MLLDILSENFLHDIEDQLAHLEHAITDALILAITGHNCTQVECELLAPLVRMGGTRLTNPYQVVVLGSVSSTKISGLLPQQKKGRHELPDDNGIGTVQWEMPQVKNQYQKEVGCLISGKMLRTVYLATYKGTSSCNTVLPIKDMYFDLEKRVLRCCETQKRLGSSRYTTLCLCLQEHDYCGTCCYEEGGNACNNHVIDLSKSILCAPDISFAVSKRLSTTGLNQI